MFSCKQCINHDVCEEVCPPLEEALREQGVYKSDYIRPQMSSAKRKDGHGRCREIPFSAINMNLEGEFDHE